MPSVFHAQKLNRFCGQSDGSGTTFVLHQILPFHRAAFGNIQHPLFYIQVASLQYDQLSLPKPRRRHQQKRGEVT